MYQLTVQTKRVAKFIMLINGLRLYGLYHAVSVHKVKKSFVADLELALQNAFVLIRNAFENAIEWLCLSGIVSRIYKVEQIKKPLENYRYIGAFKIYVSDLGLLCAKKDLVANDVLYMVEELNDFKGGMAGN